MMIVWPIGVKVHKSHDDCVAYWGESS